MKLPIFVVGILIGAVLGVVGSVIYPVLGLWSPLLGVFIGACTSGTIGIFTLKRLILSCQQGGRTKSAIFWLTAYFGVLASVIFGGVLGLTATFWALAILYGRIDNFQLLTGIIFGAFLGGLPAVVHVRRCTRMLKEICYAKYLGSLPENASNLIKAIIGQMRYRKEVRDDVMTELAAHFEDELQDCTTDEEKEQKAKRLIEDFGDAKLLAVLLRRAKKRCRPIWRTIVAKTFQTVGVLILCFIAYCVYISLGKPTISVNYVEEATRLVRPVTDESLNAALIYQKAIDAYKEPPLVKDETGTRKISLLDAIKSKDWVTGLTEEELTLMKQWLSDNADAIEFFKQASEKPYCWWKRDVKDNFVLNILMPELSPLRKIARMVVCQAKLKAYNGHTKEAFDDLLACYRAGRHLKGPRSLVEQLVGIGIQAVSTQSILVVLNNQEVDGQLLENLQIRLEKIVAEDTYTINYQVERFCALDFIQRCYTNNGRGSGHMIPGRVQEFMGAIGDSYQSNDETEETVKFGLFLAVSIASASRGEINREFDKFYDATQKWAYETPWQLHEENVDFMMGFYDGSALKQKRYWPVSFLMPALAKVSEISYRLSADVKSTLTVIALLRYRQDTGSFPESLDDLVAAGYLKNLPMDPFSDKPLVYKRTADNFTLYSVGFNFKDDGGQSGKDNKGQAKKWADNGDAVFWPVQK